MGSAGVWVAVIALVGIVRCTGTGGGGPRPDSSATDALRATNRTVFVVATRQKPRILEALAAAGITVAPDLLEAGFMLRVTVGTDQGWESCGTRNNVKYSLRREGVAVVEIAEKGWTGTCTPNVFDVLSQRLAETLAVRNGSEATPRTP